MESMSPGIDLMKIEIILINKETANGSAHRQKNIPGINYPN
jgi:hypothetical protein